MKRLKFIRKLTWIILLISVIAFILSMNNVVMNFVRQLWIKNVYYKDFFQLPRGIWEENFLMVIIKKKWSIVTKISLAIYVFLVIFGRRLLKPRDPKPRRFSYSRMYANFAETLEKIPESKKSRLLYVVSCNGKQDAYSALIHISKVKRVSLGNQIIQEMGYAVDTTKQGLKELSVEEYNGNVFVNIGEKMQRVEEKNSVNLYISPKGRLYFEPKEYTNKLLTITVL
ncbi:hypothetical protein [uncultured Eubacterium sp.]|uniref:hypothetical protein n=1 Tax=uncultured Eubacterium sp. TaxID=165185 RepID=UPI00259716B8|nr:hypothetical protein [uncultured Eubacterium sp.]